MSVMQIDRHTQGEGERELPAVTLVEYPVDS